MFTEIEDISKLSDNTLIIRHYLLHRKYSISKNEKLNKNDNNMEDIIWEHNEIRDELVKRSLEHTFTNELDYCKYEGHE